MAFKKILLSSKLVGKSTEVLTIATIISIISVAKATRLVSKTTRSLYRQIQPTDKSHNKPPHTTLIPRQDPVDVTLDSHAFTPTVIPGGKEDPSNNSSNNELFLQQQIVRLQKELTELKEKSEERENRLLTLIENKFFGRSFVLKKFLKKLLK